MDKVPRWRLLRPFQEGTHNNKSEKYKFCKQCGRLNYSRYSHVHIPMIALIIMPFIV